MTKGVAVDNNDRELILGLANRLRQAHPVAKDHEVAEVIGQYIASQPDALYLLVQAVLVQEDALRTAQAQIAELQAARPGYGAAEAPGYGVPAYTQPPVQPNGGGFMSRMFGQSREAGPMDAPQGRSGGGFLKTAAAAAAGVAGGALLFQGLNEVFGGQEASASEAHGAMEESGGWDEDEQW
ncbi:DUF2076 family protein [Amycolatopsis cynarae]|uniref:DUF2076 family protein n=1 Tax=Amycolatopsis cynarae TaxID=2995223 RepID=A0ABY7B908_9PSEU|nr:DUF2076 family protein [Amycolatopsis sp. HUAS 11-8]WAL68839.1 DUF2076 family protein [Amycolatopsis sp. HUAS 11-8]